MNKSILLLMLALLPALGHGQAKKSCCNAATQAFAMLGTSTEFRAMHETPEPFEFSPELGKDITFATAGGENARGYAVMADEPTNNYLIVFHEWWGLNNYIRQECEKLSLILGNVNILAIDLYDGQVATTREKAAELMQNTDEKRAVAIINGGIAYAGKDARIQTIGWCFGGGWSLQGTLLSNKQAIGCVMYYGMPEKNVERLKMLQAPVLGIFASQDGWINQEVVDDFEKKMTELNKPLTIKWYDANHAFANPSSPRYNESAATDANKMAVQFLKANFIKR
jgi:carboxymethylenebutenolidase